MSRDKKTPHEKAFRGSKHLLTRYLEDFGRLGCLLTIYRYYRYYMQHIGFVGVAGLYALQLYEVIFQQVMRRIYICEDLLANQYFA